MVSGLDLGLSGNNLIYYRVGGSSEGPVQVFTLGGKRPWAQRHRLHQLSILILVA